MRTLTDLESRVISFAEKHGLPIRDGQRSLIRAEFGWTPATYAQRLNRLIDDPAALAAHPQLIHRLQRMRAQAVRDHSVA